MWDMSDAYIQVVIENDCGLDEMVQHFASRNDNVREDQHYYSDNDSDSDSALDDADDAPSSNDDDTSSSGYSSMPGLIQRNNDDDSSEDDESEEDEEMSVPAALEEYTIGGEDHAVHLPGEPMEPP
jgi:hypothetical protein